MSIESDVFALLSGFTALTDLVPASRITPVIRREGSTLPAVVYSKISDNHVRNMGGATVLSEARMQVDVHAVSYSAMKGIQRQARLAMQSSESTFKLTDVSEGPDVYDEQSEEHFCTVDFIVWHRNG